MIDLSKYCPKQEFQIGGTCYAYAVAYTAYSTQFNLANSITDKDAIEKDCFSYMYVASVVRRVYLPFHKRIFDINCSWLGTADRSLEVLKEWGCIKMSEKDFKCQDGVNYYDVRLAEKYKIKDYQILTKEYDCSPGALQKIVENLNNNKPVITAIFSTDEFRENHKLQLTLDDLDHNSEDANHVVCILGYDENLFEKKGGFLIKNNYNDWGKDSFSWVRCADFMHLIDQSYSISI